MKKVKITVIRKVHHADLSTQYENPIGACLRHAGGADIYF